MNINRNLISVLICFIVVYFITSFTVLEINFFNWTLEARLFTVIIWVVVSSIIVANNEINKL